MLETIDLGQRYGRHPWLFENLNMSVQSGEILAVLGPNARGKTTLLKTLAGILPPGKGRVESTGRVGYVPQNHDGAYSFPVIEMVIMGRASKLKAYQTPGAKDRQVAIDCLERIGVAELRDRRFDHLSGGQKQLVMIARSLATDPQSLVLDEPASALDLRNQSLVLEIILRLAAEGIGIVVTTHDPGHAKFVADKVLLMDKDTTPLQGAAADLLDAEHLSRLYATQIVVADITTPQGSQSVVVPQLVKSNRRTDTSV